MGLTLNDDSNFMLLEPFFNKINLGISPQGYIDAEQSTTRYNLKSKFENYDDVDVMIKLTSDLTQDDFNNIVILKMIIQDYESGMYSIGNLSVEIK